MSYNDDVRHRTMKGAEDAPLMGESNGLIAKTPGMKKMGDEESGVSCIDTMCTKLDKYSDVFAPLGWWDPIPHLKSMAYRKSSGRAGGSFEELDGIRSLALMWVCSFHIFSCSVLGDWKNFQGEIPHALLAIIEQGQCGVTMFFVLSGFLISHIFQAIRKKGDRSLFECWKIFLYRRFWRIWPALIVSVFLVQGFASVWSGYTFMSACGTGEFWSVMWRNMCLIWNLKSWADEPGCELSPEVEWSVSTEFQLYLFTPLFVEAYIKSKRFGWIVCTAVMGVSLLLRYWMIESDKLWHEKTVFLHEGYTTAMYSEQNILYFSSYTRANEYMIGIMAHFVWGELKDLRESKDGEHEPNWHTNLWYALVSIPGQCVVYGAWVVVEIWLFWNRFYWNGHYNRTVETYYLMYNWWVMSLVTGYVIISCCAMPRKSIKFINLFLSKFLSSQALYPVAAVSYTAYLLQYLAWWDLSLPSVTNVWTFTFWEVILFVQACFIGLGLSLLVERPCMKMGRWLEPYVFPAKS